MAVEERTCVICRSHAAKRSLARLVMRGNALVWDERHVLPGRGAYVHVEVECLSKMSQVGRWERAFRKVSGSLDAAALRQVVGRLMESARGLDAMEKSSGVERPKKAFKLRSIK